jgi:hypothetical protein
MSAVPLPPWAAVAHRGHGAERGWPRRGEWQIRSAGEAGGVGVPALHSSVCGGWPPHSRPSRTYLSGPGRFRTMSMGWRSSIGGRGSLSMSSRHAHQPGALIAEQLLDPLPELEPVIELPQRELWSCDRAGLFPEEPHRPRPWTARRGGV